MFQALEVDVDSCIDRLGWIISPPSLYSRHRDDYFKFNPFAWLESMSQEPNSPSPSRKAANKEAVILLGFSVPGCKWGSVLQTYQAGYDERSSLT